MRKGPTIRKKSRLPLYLVLGVLALLTMIIVGFVFLQRWQIAQESQTPGQGKGEPVDATVLQEVTGVSPSTWESIGTGGVAQPFTPITDAAPLKGSHGLPEVFCICFRGISRERKNASTNGKTHEVCHIAQAQSFHDTRTMGLHRFDTDFQSIGDALVRLPRVAKSHCTGSGAWNVRSCTHVRALSASSVVSLGPAT